MLADLRLKEARVLLGAHCWEGAYYLAGYSVECALKACIAKQTERYEFPDRQKTNAVHTHDLDTLIQFAGLSPALQGLQTIDPGLLADWRIVREWWEQSRYERPTRAEAEDLLRAVGTRRRGILRWLRQHW